MLRFYNLPYSISFIRIRVFSEVPFWNSAEYGIVYEIDFISRNSAEFFTVQYREIPEIPRNPV